mmetsp:Transcript_74187/g.188241  ORF Transcript_74187/g.188241 Transcript_74187/m.188241 type:complete len:221 (+) Transcript_74187:3-665(+)
MGESSRARGMWRGGGGGPGPWRGGGTGSEADAGARGERLDLPDHLPGQPGNVGVAHLHGVADVLADLQRPHGVPSDLAALDHVVQLLHAIRDLRLVLGNHRSLQVFLHRFDCASAPLQVEHALQSVDEGTVAFELVVLRTHGQQRLQHLPGLVDVLALDADLQVHLQALVHQSVVLQALGRDQHLLQYLQGLLDSDLLFPVGLGLAGLAEALVRKRRALS